MSKDSNNVILCGQVWRRSVIVNEETRVLGNINRVYWNKSLYICTVRYFRCQQMDGEACMRNVRINAKTSVILKIWCRGVIFRMPRERRVGEFILKNKE